MTKLQGRIKLKGIIELEHRNASGNLVEHEVITNTITNSGIPKVAGLINGSETTAFSWLAIGDSSTAATNTDTLLASEITAVNGLDRIAATSSLETTTIADDTHQLLHTFVNDSSNTIGVQEAGIFNTSTENTITMLGRQTFAVKNLENNDTLKVTYKIVVA